MSYLLKSKKARSVLNVVFSIGAAVVIFGALAKIEHWGGAWGSALTIGMLAETFVFLLMALLPAEETYYWERFYPNITLSPEEEKAKTGKYTTVNLAVPPAAATSSPALAGMDKMLQEADITPANLKRLGENFQKLGTTVSHMNDISDVVSETGNYTKQTRETTQALVQMKDAYEKAAASIASMSASAASTQEFHEQLQQMTKNLGSLNAIYELELQDTNNHLKAMNKFYNNLSGASEAMAGTIEDSQKTKEQVALLARNLSDLNAVYGNMLSAMQRRG
jgi:gliding motility-associated protein GldL